METEQRWMRKLGPQSGKPNEGDVRKANQEFFNEVLGKIRE